MCMNQGGVPAGKGKATNRPNKGPLDTKSRKALPTESFAIPSERKYPIEDENHAEDALSRVSANGTPTEKQQVRSAVHKHYPNMGKGKK